MKALTVFDSLKLLEKYKIPVAKCFLVKKVEDAVKISKKIGFPLVLKLVSPDIIHKTDMKALVLGIKNEEELVKSFNSLMKNVKPRTKIQGVLVQKMVDGEEVIVGGKEDVQFGKVLMFGLGGIFTEVFDDVSFKIIPVSQKDVEEMMDEIKGSKILKGYRGRKYDVRSLRNILMKTSRLLQNNKKIKELDINPVMVSGKGAFAVDARIVSE